MTKRTAASELVDAVTSWHQRLYDLRSRALKKDAEGFRHGVIDYEQNRHELPRIIRNTEILRADLRAAKLVALGDEFIETFTSRAPNNLECKFCYFPVEKEWRKPSLDQLQERPSFRLTVCDFKEQSQMATLPEDDLAHVILPEYLRKSDVILQKMSLEVGRIQSA